MLPKVSIYILNYNYGKFIGQAIESCVDQSFKNIEIIIIDDGSTDDSKDIIQFYARKYPFIKTRFNKNQGLIKSCNHALKLAEGKYILRLDADDWLDRNAIEIMFNKMEKNKKIELLFPDYYEIDENNNVLHTIRRHDFKKVKLFDSPAHGACTLFRKNTLISMGGYDENFSCQDGFEIWLRFYKKFKVMNLNLPLFYYRKHGSNLTTNRNKINFNRNKILFKHKKNKFKALAFLPIRGLKYDKFSKIFQKLGNKKLIDWTIDNLLKVKNLSKIIIASPDDDVLRFIKNKKNNKLLAIKRDIKLSAQSVLIEDSLINVIKKIKKKKNFNFDYIVMSKLKNPFRNSNHIENALNIINIFNLDKVIGVSSENKTFFTHDGNSLKPLRQFDKEKIGNIQQKINVRVESEEIYKDCGAFAVYDLKYLLSKKNKNNVKIGHELLDRLSSYQIDNQFDWIMAQNIAKQVNQFKNL